MIVNKFLIDVANHKNTLDLFTCILNEIKNTKIVEHDSSYYLKDTYWTISEGSWAAKFYYTACLESENSKICGKIHLAVFINTSILTAKELSHVCQNLMQIIEEKHKIIHENEIYPLLSDEEHMLITKFLMQ